MTAAAPALPAAAAGDATLRNSAMVTKSVRLPSEQKTACSACSSTSLKEPL